MEDKIAAINSHYEDEDSFRWLTINYGEDGGESTGIGIYNEKVIETN